jgi:hypothetical protein
MHNLRLARTLAALVIALLPVAAVAQTVPVPPSDHVPLQKKIGEARPDIVPSLIVLNADGATLDGSTLTLTGVATNAIMFADRPVRSAGHALTAHLLEEWSPADGQSDSFAVDPPNATVSVFGENGGTVRDAVVVLQSPKLDGTTLTFDVQTLEGSLAGADGPAAVFIDIIGLPRTPASFAGVARRTAYRGAWYAGAAAEADATAARAYCGYPPYPPCN